jgi:GNAT superfamily N-acetyltransferase
MMQLDSGLSRFNYHHFQVPASSISLATTLNNSLGMATWRSMADSDMPAVMRIADEIHRDLPEAEAVFRERLHLFPEGCLVLAKNETVGGYVISFPIRRGKPPPLDALLGEIPPDADQYYLHDLAILPRFRGCGLAAGCIGKVLEVAKRYASVCLVSVYGTVPFWSRFGFAPELVDFPQEEKLRSYGEGATYLTRRNT